MASPAVSVRTWADGFGTWHAAVYAYGVHSPARIPHLARRAIQAELQERQGAPVGPIRLQRVEVGPSPDGTSTRYHYAEA